LVPAVLRSPSGESASGRLIFDTGAPALVVTRQVWSTIRTDTFDLHGSQVVAVRRPLGSVELGPARLPDLTVDGVVADRVLEPDVLGLFGPSQIGRAHV